MQAKIIKNLNVEKKTNVEEIIKERVSFLQEYLAKSPCNGFVLGLSGGVDSFVASMLVKEAGLNLISVLLPYGAQSDIVDSYECLDAIDPKQFIFHNIETSVNSTFKIIEDRYNFDDRREVEIARLVKANIMARERMNVQYAYASCYNYLVIGTDHATEAVTGFFTKHGDGGADILPLSGLTKDMVYELAKYFKAPECIMVKAPSAGLWDNQTDEDELGMTYRDICKYLKGEKIDDVVSDKLEKRYIMTEHKRNLPVSMIDTWWK